MLLKMVLKALQSQAASTARVSTALDPMRPNLEYCAHLGDPMYKKDIDDQVQWRVIKIVRGLENTV